MKKVLLIVFLITFNVAFTGEKQYSQIENTFLLGNEVLIYEKNDLLIDKRIALITNMTGINSSGELFLDVLLKKNMNVVKIFTPEHGFNSDDLYKSANINIPVISLYGKNKNIIDDDLNDVDILIYDIQDLGVRYYTYTSTLFLTMQDAYRNNKKFILCDRPSVLNLYYSGGFLLENSFKSFVGMIPTPVVYGLTLGELGSYLCSIIDINNKFDFYVCSMKNYSRNRKYEDINLPWVNPSPNITSLESARLYPAICFMEGTNISEGRGTDYPFQQFGAPFCNSEELLKELNKYNLEGVNFETVIFTPDKKISAYNPKYLNKKCFGIKLAINDFLKYKPVETSVAILLSLKKTTKEFKWVDNNYIDKLAGTNKLRKSIDSNTSFDDIIKLWSADVSEYEKIIQNFKIYK